MIMVTLSDGTRSVRVPQADAYPGYEGWTVTATETWPTLAMLKDAAWQQVKATREGKLQTAVTTLGTAQTDLVSMVKINGLVSMAILAKQASAAYSEVFTMADNSEVTMSADQMIQFGQAVGTHVAAMHANARSLRARIDAAADATALAAIDLTAGWQ